MIQTQQKAISVKPDGLRISNGAVQKLKFLDSPVGYAETGTPK